MILLSNKFENTPNSKNINLKINSLDKRQSIILKRIKEIKKIDLKGKEHLSKYINELLYDVYIIENNIKKLYENIKEINNLKNIEEKNISILLKRIENDISDIWISQQIFLKETEFKIRMK